MAEGLKIWSGDSNVATAVFWSTKIWRGVYFSGLPSLINTNEILHTSASLSWIHTQKRGYIYTQIWLSVWYYWFLIKFSTRLLPEFLNHKTSIFNLNHHQFSRWTSKETPIDAIDDCDRFWNLPEECLLTDTTGPSHPQTTLPAKWMGNYSLRKRSYRQKTANNKAATTSTNISSLPSMHQYHWSHVQHKTGYHPDLDQCD